MKKTSFKIYKQIEDKTIVWFEDTNNYLVLETTAASILKKIDKGVDRTQIAATLSKQTKVTLEQAKDFIIDFEKRIRHQKPFAKVEKNNHGKDVKFPTSFNSSIHYQINNSVFKISYLSALERSYIHPKFAHLGIDTPKKADYEFDVFIQDDFIYLFVEKKLVNRWAKADLHYFQGKLSMELVQKIHQKEEEECVICMESGHLILTNCCGTAICKPCAKDWFVDKSKNCPTCDSMHNTLSNYPAAFDHLTNVVNHSSDQSVEIVMHQAQLKAILESMLDGNVEEET